MSLNENPPYKSESSKDEALGRLASIGQISAGIAHEVKNPLTAVKGFLQLLQEQEPHRFIDVAQAELDRAITTLENLLNVSKPDLDEEPYTEIHLAAELESLMYLFLDKSYQVHVETNFQDTQEVLHGKRNQIKKAFFNLIKNAFEAIPDEGTITVEHVRIGNKLQVTISDTGVGIPEDKLAMLGTPFFTTKSDGTGMGLTQVFSTIYQHNGKIHVTSKLGRGTTFMIEFPQSANSAAHMTAMETEHVEGQSFAEFCELNQAVLDTFLEANSTELLNSLQDTNLDAEYIRNSAHNIIKLVNDGNEHALMMEAKKNGKTWARYDLSMILKLEWLQMLRKFYWDLLASYAVHQAFDAMKFFEVGERIHYYFDSYRNHFSASFTEYKNEYIKSQADLINDLSVPVIPLVASTAILPIIGAVDTHRAKRIQENVLTNIADLRLRRLIIDLSGVAFMDTAVVGHMFRIIEGINLLGCKAVLTGLRPEIVNTMIEIGITLTDKVETKGTLQQALEAANLVNT